MNGTSFVVPFVTGTIALLWSIFRNATAKEIVYSALRSTSSRHRSMVPPLINAGDAIIC